MRGSRSSRRAATQRQVSYAEPSLGHDFQVGSESGMDEAEAGEGDGNGHGPKRRDEPRHLAGRPKRGAESSFETRRGGRGGRGRGSRTGDGRSSVASNRPSKKAGLLGPPLDSKAAVAGSGTEFKTRPELVAAVDGKTAAMGNDDGEENEIEERKLRPGRPGRVPREGVVNGKRVSSRVGAIVVDTEDEDEEMTEAKDKEVNNEDGEMDDVDWRSSSRERAVESEESAPKRRGKRSASEKRDNPLLKKFGFRPGSAVDAQSNVDWDFVAPRGGGRRCSSRNDKKTSSSKGSQKNRPNPAVGRRPTGTPPRKIASRRSGRTRAKSLSYAEPSSDSPNTGSEGEGAEESADGTEESSEDDAFEGRRKEPSTTSAKRNSGQGSGAKGRGLKASRKATNVQPEDSRRSFKDKPTISYAKSTVGKPKVDGTRRSLRDKPPVCYIEGVADAGQPQRKRADKAEGSDGSDQRSVESDVVVLCSKKPSAATRSKAKREPAASTSTARRKSAKRCRRSTVSGAESDSDSQSEEEEEEEGEDEEAEEDGDNDDDDEEYFVETGIAARRSGRSSRAGGRNKGKGRVAWEDGSEDEEEEEELSEEDEEDEESSGIEEEEKERLEPLKVEKILAREELLPSEWSELCKNMTTDEVGRGSMWQQEESENAEPRDGEEEEKETVEKFLVKWSGMSYLHVSWETVEDLVENTNRINPKIRRFREREFDVDLELERGDGEYFDPSLTILDRVLDVDEVEGEETRLLVKWLGASYSECTYELVRDLENAGQEHAAAVEAYRRREDMSRLLNLKPTRNRSDGPPDLDKDPPTFKNGGSLRDYQSEGVRWMIFNWLHKRGSILADEMGLGKTLQTVTFLRILHKEYGIPGPFLVVAPLSTVTHWQREFQNWSDMNTIVFHGDQDDRDIIEEYEMEFAQEKELKARDKTRLRGRRVWKPTVVVTTPELCIRPDVSALLGRKIHWDVLIVDEAHRLKNNDSKLNGVLKDQFTYDTALLLTGTPLQNNTEELWTLLNLVDRPNFKDKEGFVEMYGDLQQAEDVARLQRNIKPYLLRRMKEDVEKAVPPKEETIIEVELTEVQKQYYRAIYEQNTKFLLQGKKRPQEGPSLMNLAMQLRKCCNHPYLITGVEDAVRLQMGDNADSKEHLVKHSGKLVLLDKLLPRLKEQGHRILIFSQFKIMLNILEDYLIASDIMYGRIDGSIQGNVRQKAIDSFQAPNSDMLVMLLSTKAGGVGITLTAADTCIIYDSDWNPQNDVQAQARCHRIGQTKSVKVYRLLVAKTYEMEMFKTASRKLGLDQAVLSGSRPRKAQDKAGPTNKEVEMLLKHGAYDVFKEEGAEAGRKFCEDSIDAILSRAMVVNHATEGGSDGKPSNSFSKASFVSSSNEAVDMDDPEFWTKCVGLTVPVEEEETLGRRKARSGKKEYRVVSDSDGGSGAGRGSKSDEDSAAESEFEDVQSDDSTANLNDRHVWSQETICSVAGAMFLYGYGRWEKIRDRAAVGRSLGDVAAVCRAMLAVMLQTEAIANAQLTMKKSREQRVCNKLFELVMARERKERMEKAAADAADFAATTTAIDVESVTENIAAAPAAAAADVAGGGQASASVSPVTEEGGAAAVLAASSPSVGSGMPILKSLTERATEKEKQAAAAAVRSPTEADVQSKVRSALGYLLNKHHVSRRALADMRRVVTQGQDAKRRAQIQASANVGTEKKKEEGTGTGIGVKGGGDKEGVAAGENGASTSEVKPKEEGTSTSEVKSKENDTCKSEVKPKIEDDASKPEGGYSALKPEVKPVAATPVTSSSGVSSVCGSSSVSCGASPPLMKKTDDKLDDMAILTKHWKPRNIGVGSKFRSQNLVRISTKLTTLDEMQDLKMMMESPNAPFGKILHLVPEGWRGAHDAWLVRSVWELGWFTSMQKKRAAIIQEDPKRTWPGLISMPDHVTLGRRIKALLAKFRDDKRQAHRDAERAADREKERGEARERNRKIREDNEARRRKEWEAKQAQLVEERAVVAAAVASQVNIAPKQPTLAPHPQLQPQLQGVSQLLSQGQSRRANNAADAQLQRLLAEQRGRAAVAAAVAAATAARSGTTGANSALMNGDKTQQRILTQRPTKVLRTPPLVQHLPKNVDASAGNVRTILDESGNLKGFKIWPSAQAATEATTSPEDRIRGLAGIVISGADNGNLAPADAHGKGSARNPLSVESESDEQLKLQNQHSSDGGAGVKPEGVESTLRGMPGAPAMLPTVALNGRGGSGGSGQTAAHPSALRGPLPVATSNSSSAALDIINGSQAGAGEGIMLKGNLSAWNVVASTEDGILLRHAIHNLGVPVSMLHSFDSSGIAALSGSETPIRRALDMSWLKLANGNDSLSPKAAESIGVHLLAKAAAVAKDTFGLRLPAYENPGPIPDREKDLLIAFLQSAAKATQLRASLLRYTQLREIQSFAARLARAKELRNPTMPAWWKSEVHDAHLLVASCIYGSSSDYGVQRAMMETTTVTIKTHGATGSEGKENTKVAGGSAVSRPAYALPGCATAHPMAPLCSLFPPLNALVTKTRIKNLHTAAFIQAKRLHASVKISNSSSSSVARDTCEEASPAAVVVAASQAPVIVINDNPGGSGSGSGGDVAATPEPSLPPTVASSDVRGSVKTPAKRPAPETTAVLDLCCDGEGSDVNVMSGSSAKKLKTASPGSTLPLPSKPEAASEVSVTPAPSTPATVPALSVSSTGSDSGSKGGVVEAESGESPRLQKDANDATGVAALDAAVDADKTSTKKMGGTLDSFWNSP